MLTPSKLTYERIGQIVRQSTGRRKEVVGLGLRFGKFLNLVN